MEFIATDQEIKASFHTALHSVPVVMVTSSSMTHTVR